MNSDLHILEQQICTLNERIDQLNQRLTSLEQTRGPITALPPPRTDHAASLAEPRENSLEMDGSSLLKNVSILCFLLVAALGLRALADNEILDPGLGAVLGILYAAGLICGGDILYRKVSSLAPVFCVTGTLLMFSLLVETHERFASLPGGIVYLVLAATGIGMAVISYRHNVALPVIVGSLGMCFAAVAIDYPMPYFPFLVLILWAANILGFFATRIKRCSWLRWLLLFITHAVLQVWGVKISGAMAGGKELSGVLAFHLFIPMIVLIGTTFTLIALFGILRAGDERVSTFDFSLPTVNAAWCYVAAIYALKNPALFSVPAAVAALVYFGLAYGLSRRKTLNSKGTNTFVAGGVILLCLSLPSLFGSFLAPLPILALLAYASCYCSDLWGSGGMRITGYVLQVYLAVLLALSAFGNFTSERTVILFIAAFCGVVALFQFRFCRQHSPPQVSVVFKRYDRSDKSALALFFAGLTDLFFFVRAAAHSALGSSAEAGLQYAATGIESATINFAAIMIMLMAYRKNNPEMRHAGIVILLIGGSKVFLFDLFNMTGSWLVVSIFSVGIAAAVASLILARWTSRAAPREEFRLAEEAIGRVSESKGES